MKCLECNTSDFEYNEAMGETACKECGLIVATEMFEETIRSVSNSIETHTKEKVGLGSIITSGKFSKTQNRYGTRDSHIRKAVVLSHLVLSNVNSTESLRDRVDAVYRELYAKNLFKGVTLEVRATAVVWFVMKENKTPITAKKASEEFNCSGKSLNRLIRKINSYYGSRMKYLQPDPQYLLKKVANQITDDIVFISQCMETLELFEPIVISSGYNKTPAYYESICWISKNIFVYPRITLKLIAEKCDASWSAIQKQTKVLLGLIGLETCAQVKGKQISELERRE
tara:strand:- start:171 stop:1025 length:855 start_codon:yes stop_codon:yes gene_type:complete